MDILIGGNIRPWKFNQEALELFVKNINWDQGTSSSEVYAGFYAGLVAACRVKQIKVDFTFEQVCDWVDDLNDAMKADVMAAVAETQKYKEWLSEFQDKIRLLTNPDKKKVVRKTKKTT